MVFKILEFSNPHNKAFNWHVERGQAQFQHQLRWFFFFSFVSF